jgi:hypothetical protein
MKTVLLPALLLISLALPWPEQKLPENILAISDVTVIDATGAPAKPNMTVIITGDQNHQDCQDRRSCHTQECAGNRW